MKVKSESEVAQSCPTLHDPMDCSPPGSSIHGIFQARVLEWDAIALSMHMLLLTSYFPFHFLLYICLLSSLEGHKLHEARDFILFNALNFVDSYCFVK